MSGKVFFRKVLSSVLCLALILSVIGGLSFSVSAADYNWGANWRYKTSEGGEWQYPASDKDVFTYYNGTGYFWADFNGNTPTNFNMGIGSHPGMQINAGSTLIITNSNPSAGETKFWNNTPDNNLMQTMGGTIIIGEGVWIEKTNGKSAISLENGSDSKLYAAGRIDGGGGFIGIAVAQGVWTNSGGIFNRLGRDNANKNDGGMVYNDYYKLTLNKGDNVTAVDEGDYLFKGREFEPYLANGAHFYSANADHEISCTVEEGYHFTSWTGDASYSTQTANANFSGYTARTLTANAEINKYTVNFVSGVTGETLKTESDIPHGSAATAPSPANIVKVEDDANHKVFSGWDKSFSSVTENMTVTAEYTDAAHSYIITSHNESGHTLYCEECGYVKEGVGHTFDDNGFCECGFESLDKADYTAVESAKAAAPKITVYYTDESVAALNDAVNAVEYNLYAGKQAQVDAMAANINSAISGLTVKQYNISVSGEGCSISQTLPAGSHYYLATVRAPKTNSAGEYFTYWKDGNGEIVGTYRNYSFYVVSDVTLTPVFTAPASYESARQEAVIAGRILDVKTSKDGTVVVFGEHSVSSTEGSINGHGILATTDSSLANDASMNKDNNNPDVLNFMASTTSATLTGIVEAQAKMTGSTVWVRTYIIDKNGETEYGDIKSYTINANSNAADDEIIMLDSQSYDLTAENEGNDTPAQVDEPTEESNDIIAVILDMLKTIAARIVNYIKLALAIIK